MPYPPGYRWGRPLPEGDSDPLRRGTTKLRRKARRLGWKEVTCGACGALTYARDNGRVVAHYPERADNRKKFCRGPDAA
jgi:hypothetical protein